MLERVHLPNSGRVEDNEEEEEDNDNENRCLRGFPCPVDLLPSSGQVFRPPADLKHPHHRHTYLQKGQ